MSTPTSSRQIYFRLLGYVRPYWKMLALGLLLSALAAAMEPFLPALMKPLLDNGFTSMGSSKIDDNLLHQSPWIVPATIIGVMTLRGILTFCSGYVMAWVQTRLVDDLRQEMFEHVARLPMMYFSQTSSGRTMTRLTNDVNNISAAATSVGVTLVRESLSIIGLLAYLLYLNWQLTLVTLTVLPFISWVTRTLGKRIRIMSRAWQDGMGLMTLTLQENLLCQKIIKVFGGKQQEIKRFKHVSNMMRGYAMRSATAAAVSTPLVHFFSSIAIAIVVYMALLQSVQGEATVGSFVSFITGMLMLMAPMRALTGINGPLQRGLAAAESVFELLDAVPEEDKGSKDFGRCVGRLTFKEVCFRYPNAERDALTDVTIDIAPGQTVALVGPSGGGKTTFAAMVPRFFNPNTGTIQIDEHDIQGMTLQSLRRNIAYVSQDVLLFDDTVAANIAYGDMAGASREAIEAAALAANALEFIERLPNGFDTIIGENGNSLSGGQRQRLAIARAILKDAPILILDEATSALDNESERLVQDALEKLMKERTTLVIAHRLSTIEKADRIVVMGEGQILESGRHDELLAHNGAYARLHSLQIQTDIAQKLA